MLLKDKSAVLGIPSHTRRIFVMAGESMGTNMWLWLRNWENNSIPTACREQRGNFHLAYETFVTSAGTLSNLCLFPSDMTPDTALSLDGTGRLDYALKQGPKRDVLLRQSLQGAASNGISPSSLEVKFRTRSKTGTLLHIQESSNYTTIKVRKEATKRSVFHEPICPLVLLNSVVTPISSGFHPVGAINGENLGAYLQIKVCMIHQSAHPRTSSKK